MFPEAEVHTDPNLNRQYYLEHLSLRSELALFGTYPCVFVLSSFQLPSLDELTLLTRRLDSAYTFEPLVKHNTGGPNPQSTPASRRAQRAMADDQDNANQSGIPAWQRESSNATPAPATSSDQSDDKLTVARRFLEDEEVRTASREKKVAFLRAKGIEDGDIEILLGKAEEEGSQSSSPSTAVSSDQVRFANFQFENFNS